MLYRLIISIAIGYGENQGQNHKSKHVDQISHSAGERPEWFENGVEMALLAPTAMNQQKFMIELNEDESVEFTDKGGSLYMRPVIFSSIALVYRIWLDLKKLPDKK